MISEGISDGECVRSVQKGETDAFEILIHRHQKTIFNLAYRLLGDYEEATDTAQEVFLSAYRSIQQFRGEAAFSTWLYRIAVNHATTRRKSLAQARQRMVPLAAADPVSDGHLGPAETAAQREIQDRVQEALNHLEPSDALIILLRDLQDAPYEEVARILEVPIGTVKSRLHRARQALKSRLACYFYSDRKEP
jgi:RNA polymerase sigma-70 factor, ECF subfamily